LYILSQDPWLDFPEVLSGLIVDTTDLFIGINIGAITIITDLKLLNFGQDYKK